MALAALGVAQHGPGTLLGDERLSLRLDHRHRVAVLAIGPVLAIVTGPFVAGTIIARSVCLEAVFAGPVFAGAFVPPAVAAAIGLGPRSIVAGPIIAGPVVAGPVVAGPIIPRPFVPGTIAVVPTLETVVAGPIVSGSVIPGPVIPGPVVAGPVVAGSVVLPAGLGFRLRRSGRLATGGGLGGRFVGGLGLGLGALVLKVDVEAGGKVVAAKDVAGRALRLHGAQQAEVVLGVLKVVLRQDAVAGRARIPGELLVFLKNRLGVAADFDAFRPAGIEGPVGVLRLLAAATAPAAAATAAVAAALTLHSLEISHCPITVRFFPGLA